MNTSAECFCTEAACFTLSPILTLSHAKRATARELAARSAQREEGRELVVDVDLLRRGAIWWEQHALQSYRKLYEIMSCSHTLGLPPSTALSCSGWREPARQAAAAAAGACAWWRDPAPR